MDAQQARRVLDRIVGYELSPLAGRRCAAVFLRAVCSPSPRAWWTSAKKEIESFKPEEYWTLDAQLLDEPSHKTFTAHYYGKNGKKFEPSSREEIDAVIADTKSAVFAVKSVKRADKQRSPSPPFTTSTLQQEASRKLNMTPRRTMAIAQQLYEGVDVAGEGTVGLITYMRTDSLRISEEALSAAKRFILGRYGKDYYPATTRRFKAKAGAQDAHEAIRPSNVDFTPERLKGDLTGEQYRLYRLIWSRFLASQMANAVYDSVAVEIASGVHEFRASASSLKFSGYTAVYEEARDDDKEEKDLPAAAADRGADAGAAGASTRSSTSPSPPTRYTDATLIRALEQNGIGRPSTYAPTVSTIIDREYVVKEGRIPAHHAARQRRDEADGG